MTNEIQRTIEKMKLSETKKLFPQEKKKRIPQKPKEMKDVIKQIAKFNGRYQRKDDIVNGEILEVMPFSTSLYSGAVFRLRYSCSWSSLDGDEGFYGGEEIGVSYFRNGMPIINNLIERVSSYSNWEGDQRVDSGEYDNLTATLISDPLLGLKLMRDLEPIRKKRDECLRENPNLDSINYKKYFEHVVELLKHEGLVKDIYVDLEKNLMKGGKE